MSELGNKLGLYKRNTIAENQKDQSSKPEHASIQNSEYIFFGEYRFQAESEAFYRCHFVLDHLEQGKLTLKEFLPFQLTGILELSLITNPDAIHPEDVLFLDTETTGLSRGAGTIPFLIGLAYFQKQQLHIELLFIQSPIGEKACLEHLAGLWQNFRYLVSYNGRAFDMPLIRNRLIMHRKQGLKPLRHFDLLHIFRRMFPRGSLAGYKQQDLEKEIFDFERTDDLPGEAIPQIYFDYIKYEHDGGLERIFRHNDLDLRGLVLLFLQAIRLYDRRDSARGSLRSGLARILLQAERDSEALEILEKIEHSPSKISVLRYRDRFLLAQIYRRRRNFRRAGELFAALVKDYNCPYARMALARLLEHRLKNLSEAREHARVLLEQHHARVGSISKELTGRSRATHRIFSESELEHRLKRLERKML